MLTGCEGLHYRNKGKLILFSDEKKETKVTEISVIRLVKIFNMLTRGGGGISSKEKVLMYLISICKHPCMFMFMKT